jgi:hypothetical protein
LRNTSQFSNIRFQRQPSARRFGTRRFRKSYVRYWSVSIALLTYVWRLSVRPKFPVMAQFVLLPS